MRTLIFILLLNFASCNDENKSSESLINSSDSPTISTDTSEDESLDEIISELESSQDDLENVYKAFEDENSEPLLTTYPDFIAQFDLQVSRVFDIEDKPVFYVFAHKHLKDKKEYFDIVRVADYGENSTKIKGSAEGALGRVRTVFHEDERPYIVTNRPLNIVSIQSEKVVKLTTTLINGLTKQDASVIPSDKITTTSLIKNAGNICGLLRTDGFASFIYNTQNKKFLVQDKTLALPSDGKLSRQITCLNNQIYFVMSKDDTKSLYRFNQESSTFKKLNTINEMGSKLNLFFREGRVYLRSYFPVNETRLKRLFLTYIVQGDNLTPVDNSLPRQTPNKFRYLKILSSTKNASVESPTVDFIIHDRKQKILRSELQFSLTGLPHYMPKIRSLKRLGSKLMVTSTKKDLFELSEDTSTFFKHGNPLGFNVQAITQYKDKVFISANGNRLLEWDPTKDWTYQSIDKLLLARSDGNHNPKIVKQFNDLNLKNIKGVMAGKNHLILHGTLKETNADLLFNYSTETEAITSKHQSKASKRITSTQLIDDELVIAKRFVGKRELFTDELSASISWIDSNDLTDKNSLIPLIGKKDIRSLTSIDNDLITYISHGSIYNFRSNVELPKKIFTYSGMKVLKLIKTPNNKFLTISDGNIILIDPVELETKILYEITNSSISRLRDSKLIDDKLIIIDQNFKLHKIKIPFAELNYFNDKEEGA
jgi:hypothetical protein